MTAHKPIREAKEFLVNTIVNEAKRQNVPISEIERKMLYFSETAWTLPDMAEVNERFDREYDQGEFEAKITGLVQTYLARSEAKSEDELKKWGDAVEILSEEDHYLLVMIRAAHTKRSQLRDWLPDFSNSHSQAPLKAKPGDRLRLWIMAFVLTVGMLVVVVFWDRIKRTFGF